MANISTAFIVNPHAGNRSTGADWPRIRAAAQKRLGPFDTTLTTGPGHAQRVAYEMVVKGVRRIVGVGGDGTLNEIINGCMRARRNGRHNVVLGFIPNGTGCDIVKTLAIPKDNDQAVGVVADGKPQSIDIGRMRYAQKDGTMGTCYFHNIASFGLGGEVVASVNGSRKTFGPTVTFLMATLKAVLCYAPKQVMLAIDDDPPRPVRVWHAAVANGRYHGGGMQMAPDADPSDGFFNVTVIGDLTLPEIFVNLRHLYNGQLYGVKKVTTFRARRVRATTDEAVLLDVDGEQPGRLPIEIDLFPAAVKILTAQRP